MHLVAIVNGLEEVSRDASTAQSETTAAATTYQAGAMSLPVQAISRVATNGAVPPKIALARLKLSANPVYRTRVGNSSDRKEGRVPSFRVSTAPRTTWMMTTSRKLAPSSSAKAGTVSTMNSTEAVISILFRPNRSEAIPVKKMKPM